MKLSKREKILIVLVLIIAGSLAYIFLFLKPTLDETTKLDSLNNTNQGIILINQQLKTSISQVEQELSDNNDKLAAFGDIVTSAFDQPPVLVYLYSIMSDSAGDKTGDKIMIDFASSGDLGLVQFSRINVTMKGSYSDLKSVMTAFSESDYFIKVVSLVVQPPPQETEESDKQSEETDKEDPSFTDNFKPVTEKIVDNRLDISMELEIYNVGYFIKPDTTYNFTGGAVQYGGDIFRQTDK